MYCDRNWCPQFLIPPCLDDDQRAQQRCDDGGRCRSCAIIRKMQLYQSILTCAHTQLRIRTVHCAYAYTLTDNAHTTRARMRSSVCKILHRMILTIQMIYCRARPDLKWFYSLLTSGGFPLVICLFQLLIFAAVRMWVRHRERVISILSVYVLFLFSACALTVLCTQ
jgi:hypothetical protein